MLSRVRLLATPWSVARQAPLSVRFSGEEDWSGLALPSPGDLPNPGIEPGSPALPADSLPSEPNGGVCATEWVIFCKRFPLFSSKLFQSRGTVITMNAFRGFLGRRRYENWVAKERAPENICLRTWPSAVRPEVPSGGAEGQQLY